MSIFANGAPDPPSLSLSLFHSLVITLVKQWSHADERAFGRWCFIHRWIEGTNESTGEAIVSSSSNLIETEKENRRSGYFFAISVVPFFPSTA